MKERVVQETDKAVSSQSRHQSVTHAAPEGFQDASPDVPPFKLPEVGYHDDFWKVLVNLARSYDPKPQPQPQPQPQPPQHSDDHSLMLPYAMMPGYDPKPQPQPQHSQDLSLMLPYAMMPGYDAPNSIQPFSMQPAAPAQPFLTSSDYTISYFDFLGPQLDATISQEPSFEGLFLEDYGLPHYNELLNALPQ